MAGHGGGQTLNDRLTAAKHTLAGQGLARIVCKATTEEVIGPKKKHLDNLLHCTNEPNVSIPQLANLLIERTQHSSWVVVFKSLITVHHLMCYGNERFTQYLASSNCTFQLGSFLDKCGVQGYDMSTFIRRYAKYLNEKAVSYRTVAFDFCKCKRGKDDGILRTMNTEKLLKTLPCLQNQLDALLEFDCSANDLSNGVVNSCFMLLFRDLIRLFACYNDGIINLLEKYFDMNKKHCREALDIYKKFLIRMDRVAEFLKVAENVGIDKGDIPDLTKLVENCRKIFGTDHAPSSLLEALEQHLATLEGRKGSTSAASTAARATNLKNAVSALSHTSNAFGSAGESNSPQQEVNGIKVDDSVRKAVEEEAEVMSQLKFDHDSPLLWEQPAWEDSERRMKEVTSGEVTSPLASAKTNPFLSSPAEPANPNVMSNQGIIDLFSAPMSPGKGEADGDTNASNDLLGLSGNPFADSLFSGQQQQQTPQEQTFSSFVTNGFSSNADAFASDASFAAAFGDTTSTGLEKNTAKLSLPVLEPFGGRSTSPSPTADIMRGAGTTPILANPPEGLFGDAVETAEEAVPTSTASGEENTDFWGNESATTPTTAENKDQSIKNADPFGAAFDMPMSTSSQPPTAVVPPLSVHSSTTDTTTKSDLFGFDTSDFGDFGEQPLSAQPCAPPPSPFSGFDIGFSSTSGSTPDLRTQAVVNSAMAPLSNPPSHLAGVMPTQLVSTTPGMDSLNFALQKNMQIPSGNMMTGALSPTMSSSFPGPGMMGPRPGVIGHPFPPAATCLPPGSTPPPASTSMSRLDNLGGSGLASTPTGRASSTPGYGTPPSGLSSPAKSVGAFGTPTGNFDAFGDTLQPHTPTGRSSGEKSSSSFLKGDLDSTLASLASNLDINERKQSIRKPSGHQWNSAKPQSKPTAAGAWATPTSGIGAVPGAVPANMAWSASPQHGFPMQAPPVSGQWGNTFPQQGAPTGILPQQPYMVGGVRPVAAPVVPPMQMSMGMAGPQVASQPIFSAYTAPQMPLVPPTSTGLPSQTASVNDPFGAL